MAKSLYVECDDLTVGEYYAVVGCKAHDSPLPIAGLAFQVKAINMPFLVGKLVMDPAHAPITLDLRFLHLMRCSTEFVTAQMPQMPQGMVMTPQALMKALRGKP